MENKKQIFDMGDQTSEVFRGNSPSTAVHEIYGESADLFANIIKSKLPDTEKEYSLVDIGSSKGELLSDVVNLLPEYHFNITATDMNAEAVSQNSATTNRVVADAEALPFADNGADIITMRYVLQFNSLEGQERIIKEISRTVKEFAVVEHGGSDGVDAEAWREKVGKIFEDDDLPQIKRKGMFWSSAEEVESLMEKNNIRFERVLSKKIDGLSQVYIERYLLNDDQSSEIRKMLEGKDYLVQTTWIIYPKETK